MRKQKQKSVPALKPAPKQEATASNQKVQQDKPAGAPRYRYQPPEQPEEWVPDTDFWR